MVRRGALSLAAAVSFLVAAAPPPVAKAPQPRIPVEAFAELPFLSDPVLSPDGRKLAAEVLVGGDERIAIFDISSLSLGKPVVMPVGDKATIRSISWAGNDRILIGLLTMSKVYNLPVPMTRLLSYDLAARKVSIVGNGRGLLGDDVIFADPAGRYVLLSAQKTVLDHPSVDKVDLVTGETQNVQKAKQGIWSWFADEQGVVRAGIDYDDRRMKVFYRPAEGAPLKRLDTIKFAAVEDSVIDAIKFVPASDKVFVISNGASGRFGVYQYDFATDAIGAPLFEHPKVDVTAITMSGAGVESVLYEDERPRVKWLSPDMAKLQEQIDRTLKGKDNRIVGKSRDGNIVLFWSGGADDPGTYVLYDRAAKRMNGFVAPFEKLGEHDFAPVQPVEYAARDGLTIPAYLTLPRGKDPRGLPLIIMPHGGPFARTSWAFDPHVQFLANRGYAVLQPNFRGSTGYGRDFVARGFGQWGTGMSNDIDDGVDWLVKRGTVDPKRVCIMGASYGGYAALWGAIRAPERYRCAISFAGVTDVRAMLKFDGKAMSASRYFKQWRRRVEGEEKTDLAAISPLQQAARLSIPVLIAHGEEDNNVPPEQSHKLVAALKARQAVVESIFYKQAGHSFRRTEDAADYLKRVEAFLAKHNPS